MKHTNIYAMYRVLYRCEIEELKKALAAYGGSYNWTEENDCPIVTYNPESPFDIRIEKIWADKYNVYFDGKRLDTGDTYKSCSIEDVEYSHIDFILSEIPETEEVSDVSSNIDYSELFANVLPNTSINKVYLCGKVGSVRINEVAGKKFIQFSLCTTRVFKDSEEHATIETSWHNIEAFESDDIKSEHIQKGNTLYVRGRIKYDKYTDFENREIVATKIVAKYVSPILTPVSNEHNN